VLQSDWRAGLAVSKALVAPQTWSGARAHEFSDTAMAMPELHAARFVSEAASEGLSNVLLERQALRQLDAVRSSRCPGAERDRRLIFRAFNMGCGRHAALEES
jgi:hypothetical protein